MSSTDLHPLDAHTTDPVRYFDSIAERYAAQASGDPCFLERVFLFSGLIEQHSPLGGDGLAVDLGCGSGVIAAQLAAAGMRTVGIDGSPAMLEEARRHSRPDGRLEFRRSHLPLPEDILGELAGTADLVVASSVIEYIEDDKRFLGQCARLLKPGGTALVSFANRRSVYRRAEAALRDTVPLGGQVTISQRHQHTEQEARQCARQAGLEPLRVLYYTLPAHRHVHRAVGNRRPPWLATLFVLVMMRP